MHAQSIRVSRGLDKSTLQLNKEWVIYALTEPILPTSERFVRMETPQSAWVAKGLPIQSGSPTLDLSWRHSKNHD